MREFFDAPKNVNSQWTVFHAPAVNTVATITKAAAGAGHRHVCTGLIVAARGGTTAPAAIQLTAHLRDGATGAGTPLLTFTLVVAAAAAAKDEIVAIPLHIVGSAATAMCLEFTAAGGANTFESVAMTGFTAKV